MHAFRFLFASVFVLATLAACSTQPVSRTSIDRVLKAPDVPRAPYAEVVVVGVAPSRELSRELEEGLTRELSAAGIRAHSFVKASASTRPSREAVEELARSTDADAVIMLSGKLAGAQLERHSESPEMDAQPIGGGFVNYFRYDYKEYASPTWSDMHVDVSLVADLFDVASSERVYTIESSTTKGTSDYEILTAQSKAIVARMRKDRMIR